MGYYIWRGGSWRRVESGGWLEDGSRLRFVFVRRGLLRAAPRRSVLRRLAARTLRRAAPLPSRAVPARALRYPHREACCHSGGPPPPPHAHCCRQHCHQQQHQSTTQPHQTEQPQQTEQQNNQLPTEQQNNQLPAEQQNNEQQNGSETSSQEGGSACKELMLDYADVNRIKQYLGNHPTVFGSVDSKLFHDDEVYRSTVLFRFQPLVKINRLPSIENYFKSNVTLKEFAANLGLKHIDDPEPQKRYYKTRNNIDKNFSKYFGEHFFDKGSDKENDQKNSAGESETDSDSEGSSETKSGRRVTQKEIDNILNEPKHLRSNVSEIQISPTRVRERDGNRAKAQVSRKRKRDDDSDHASAGKQEGDSVKVGASKRDVNKKSGRFFTKKDRSNFVKSGRVAKLVSFKSGSGREYSSLEDHAIVAWVHNAGRSRLVNGNRVWRRLQDCYGNITGHVRTWQSLRNRYLRHILPALPTLRLSSDMQETLRADAAIGELKLSRKKSMTRRNSIFKDDKVESAWSRQARTQGHRDADPPPTTEDHRAHTRHQDAATERVTRARADASRTKPNDDEHSSASDEFQPKPSRPTSDQRRNNDIRRLAHRMMRRPTLASTANDASKLNNNDSKLNNGASKLNNSASKLNNSASKLNNSAYKLNNSASTNNKNVLQLSKNDTNTNKQSIVTPKVTVSIESVVEPVDKPTSSASGTRNSVSSVRRAPANSSPNSSARLFNATNLRAPRTLGGEMYTSPNKKPAAGKQRLSADKQMARGGGHKRALYNHAAFALSR